MEPVPDDLRAAAIVRGLVEFLDRLPEPDRMHYLGRLVDRIVTGVLPIASMERVLRLAGPPYASAFEVVVDASLRVLITVGQETLDTRHGLQVARAPGVELRHESAVALAQRYLLRLITLTEKAWSPLACDPSDVEVMVQIALRALTHELGSRGAAVDALTERLRLLYPANDTGDAAWIPVLPER